MLGNLGLSSVVAILLLALVVGLIHKWYKERRNAAAWEARVCRIKSKCYSHSSSHKYIHIMYIFFSDKNVIGAAAGAPHFEKDKRRRRFYVLVEAKETKTFL